MSRSTSHEIPDRPRTGANQDEAGSPFTQVRVREVYSMTDAVQVGTEWVPRFGMSEVPRERAKLIRGLFELAAWVADHPELPVPTVRAVVWPSSRNADFSAACSEVDQVGAALGVQPELHGGHYDVSTEFGPVEVTSFAISGETMAAHTAHMSYADNVQPAPAAAEAAGGAR
jgi:hypothetical protein